MTEGEVVANGQAAPANRKWSLAMIVRDCAAELERCLKTIAAYPDEVVVVNTGLTPEEKGFAETNAVAKKFGAKVFHFPWVEDFSAARNFSFEKCSHDVVMWLDSDDIVDGAAMLDRVIRQSFSDNSVGVLYAEYLYAFDRIDFDKNKPVKWGNCTAVLTRERIVDRRCFTWRAPIHEVLCETFGVNGLMVPPQMARIRHVHLHDEESTNGSLERNLRVLEHHYNPVDKGGLGEYCEERMLFYWANTLTGLRRFPEAIQKYLEYIPRSGSNPEIQQAFQSASECARLIGNLSLAKALGHQACDKNPDAPTPYFMLAQVYKQEGNEPLAEHYALECLERANKINQEMISNPKVIFGGSAILAANCKLSLNKLDDIEPLLGIAERFYGKECQDILQIRAVLTRELEKRKLMTAYGTLREAIGPQDTEKMRALARVAPPVLRSHPEIARFLPKHRPEGKRTITFLCTGGMPPPWGPELLKTGIGGSEEAVCYLSEQFVKKGWHVEVFAPCKRQTWQGVEWYPFEEFPGSDDESPTDVLVVWRSPFLLETLGSRAKRTYVWLHDMPTRGLWPNGIWNGYDGIFVLSEFHKRVYDFVPDSKKIVSANGLPSDRLVPIDQLANEPHRMVYASDPTRGLLTVLTWWEHIRKAVPDAELDVYYGFHPTLMAACRRPDPYGRQLAATVKKIDELRKQDGVNWHGFVGHEQLHAGFAKCGLWLYPSAYDEISCITAMKMQAHGVVPVTSEQGALAETVQHGVKIPGDPNDVAMQKAWFDAVVAQANNPWTREQRLDMATDARSKFSWASVADQWHGLFEKDLALPKRNRFYERGRAALIRAAE